MAEASGTALLSLVVLGVVCTALALALFFTLIREVGPQRALVITSSTPRSPSCSAFCCSTSRVRPRTRHRAAGDPDRLRAGHPAQPRARDRPGPRRRRRLRTVRPAGLASPSCSDVAGRTAPRVRRATTTRSGGARSTATPRSTSGSAWRRSSPGWRGSRSCASGPPSARRSRASTRRRSRGSVTRRSTGSSPTPASCATGRRSGPPSPTRGGHEPGPGGPGRPRCAHLEPCPATAATARRTVRRARRHARVGRPRPRAQGAGDPLRRPTTAYALMQACGLVDDHVAGCSTPSATPQNRGG